MFNLLKHAIVSLTWSERPVWISPPLRSTRFRKGRFVQRLWRARKKRGGKAERTFVGLGSIDTSHIRDRKGDGIEDIMVYRAEGAHDLLRESLGLPPITDFEQPGIGGRVLRLDLAITEMKPGWSILRWFEGATYLGLGHAWVQVEGVLSRQSDETHLLKFVQRRRHSGITTPEAFIVLPGYSNWQSSLSKSLPGALLQQIAHDILKELDAELNKAS